MSSLDNDRFLWLVLGASLFFAGRGLLVELRRVRELTEIRHEKDEDHMISEGTEDALKLETLQKLCESSSFDLRSAALRIVSERSTKGSTRDLLLEDLSSDDRERRNKALTALHFLVTNRALSRSAVSNRLKDVTTFKALVDCLCHFLDEHTDETCTTNSPILPKTRPPSEKKALNTLNVILGENIPAALEAGVIKRWLSKYPFPCRLKNESSDNPISCVVTEMKTWWNDDAVMSSIFSTLTSHKEGVRQLEKWGLKAHPGTGEIHNDSESESDVWMVDGDDTAGPRRSATRRHPEESAEEQALRRRRREAMVFSEGGRPLGNENIIQPLHT